MTWRFFKNFIERENYSNINLELKIWVIPHSVMQWNKSKQQFLSWPNVDVPEKEIIIFLASLEPNALRVKWNLQGLPDIGPCDQCCELEVTGQLLLAQTAILCQCVVTSYSNTRTSGSSLKAWGELFVPPWTICVFYKTCEWKVWILVIIIYKLLALSHMDI